MNEKDDKRESIKEKLEAYRDNLAKDIDGYMGMKTNFKRGADSLIPLTAKLYETLHYLEKMGTETTSIVIRNTLKEFDEEIGV